MKILFLCFDFSVLGGVQAHNKAFFEALKNSGHSVKLIMLHHSSYIEKIFFSAQVFFAFLVYKPQLIITGHVNFSPLCFIAKKLIGIKYAVIVHGIDVWGLKSRSKIIALKNADVIISVSYYTAERMKQEISGYKGIIIVIPNVVDEKRFIIQEKSNELLVRHRLINKGVILTVARLSAEEKYKGYDRVIEALPLILKEIPNAHYLIVGDGSDRARVTSLIERMNLENYITLVGRVSDDILPDYYNLADVFVMPSSGEGFGIVFIESMACGIPVVAGNRDGSVDATLNGEIGLLVNPDSTKDIASAVVILLRGMDGKGLCNRVLLRNKTIEAFGVESFRKKINSMLRMMEKESGI